MKRLAWMVIVFGAVVAAGCTGVREAPVPGPAPEAGTPGGAGLYVAIGASESVGFGTDEPLREAWPQVFFRTALPRDTAFVNLAIPGSTVARALERQVPEAVALQPRLCTVWLNVNDITAGVTAAEYEQQLGELVRRLRSAGAGVLVANTPELDRLPALPGAARDPASLKQVVAGYNAATERVAAREGAVLVDLHAAGLAARDAGTEASLISDDGFHPSPAGHRAVAAAFAEALDRSKPRG